jgi:ADP-heptose:LPS heptosyltransferase
VEVLPETPGVQGHGDDAAGREQFFARMRALHIDLACQMHGGGRFSNPFLSELHPRHSVGLQTPDAAPLERTLPYVYYQHEVARWIEVASLAGASPALTEPQLDVTDAERELSRARWPESDRPLLVVHPGATDPRRRWPAASFAAVARTCAGDGWRVAVVGDSGDAAVADGVARLAGHDGVESLGGRLSLSELIALLNAATVFLGNDSGPRHLAHAVGTPTAGVFWIGNVINGAPLSRRRHRVQMAWTAACPVCGVDVTQVGWTAPRCPHDVSFVADVPVSAVLADVRELAAAP